MYESSTATCVEHVGAECQQALRPKLFPDEHAPAVHEISSAGTARQDTHVSYKKVATLSHHADFRPAQTCSTGKY